MPGIKLTQIPDLPIPLGNQLGVLQRQPLAVQARLMPVVASQLLPSLLAYQLSSAEEAPSLHDPKNAQFYFSDAFALINWLTSNPDAGVRVAKDPHMLKDTIEKLLRPDIETDMKPLERRGGATFEADFGSMLQFVSTILIREEHLPSPPHPRIQELIPKLKAWKKKYRGRYISKVSDRLIDQLEGNVDLAMVRESQMGQLVCGYVGCTKSKNLSACGQCQLQRYCSTEHQKGDWKHHKTICNKGLVEK